MELDLEKVKKQLKFSSKKCQNTVKSKLYSIESFQFKEVMFFFLKSKNSNLRKNLDSKSKNGNQKKSLV